MAFFPAIFEEQAEVFQFGVDTGFTDRLAGGVGFFRVRVFDWRPPGLQAAFVHVLLEQGQHQAGQVPPAEVLEQLERGPLDVFHGAGGILPGAAFQPVGPHVDDHGIVAHGRVAVFAPHGQLKGLGLSFGDVADYLPDLLSLPSQGVEVKDVFAGDDLACFVFIGADGHRC